MDTLYECSKKRNLPCTESDSVLWFVVRIQHLHWFVMCLLPVFCSSRSTWGSSGINWSFMLFLLQSSRYHRPAVSWASRCTHTNTLQGYWLGMHAHILYRLTHTHHWEFVHGTSPILRIFPKLSSVGEAPSLLLWVCLHYICWRKGLILLFSFK